MSLNYYCSAGRSYYASAARFGMREVFQQLAGRFDYYRGRQLRLATQYLAA